MAAVSEEDRVYVKQFYDLCKQLQNANKKLVDDCYATILRLCSRRKQHCAHVINTIKQTLATSHNKGHNGNSHHDSNIDSSLHALDLHALEAIVSANQLFNEYMVDMSRLEDDLPASLPGLESLKQLRLAQYENYKHHNENHIPNHIPNTLNMLLDMETHCTAFRKLLLRFSEPSSIKQCDKWAHFIKLYMSAHRAGTRCVNNATKAAMGERFMVMSTADAQLASMGLKLDVEFKNAIDNFKKCLHQFCAVIVTQLEGFKRDSIEIIKHAMQLCAQYQSVEFVQWYGGRMSELVINLQALCSA